MQGIERTSIKFNTKDVADFGMKKKIVSKDTKLCCQIAAAYVNGQSMQVIGQSFDLVQEQVKRELKKHLRHTLT